MPKANAPALDDMDQEDTVIRNKHAYHKKLSTIRRFLLIPGELELSETLESIADVAIFKFQSGLTVDRARNQHEFRLLTELHNYYGIIYFSSLSELFRRTVDQIGASMNARIVVLCPVSEGRPDEKYDLETKYGFGSFLAFLSRVPSPRRTRRRVYCEKDFEELLLWGHGKSRAGLGQYFVTAKAMGHKPEPFSRPCGNIPSPVTLTFPPQERCHLHAASSSSAASSSLPSASVSTIQALPFSVDVAAVPLLDGDGLEGSMQSPRSAGSNRSGSMTLSPTNPFSFSDFMISPMADPDSLGPPNKAYSMNALSVGCLADDAFPSDSLPRMIFASSPVETEPLPLAAAPRAIESQPDPLSLNSSIDSVLAGDLSDSTPRSPASLSVKRTYPSNVPIVSDKWRRSRVHSRV